MLATKGLGMTLIRALVHPQLPVLVADSLGGLAASPAGVAFDSVEFNSSSEEWLKDVPTDDVGFVELSWSPGAEIIPRAPYRGESKPIYVVPAQGC